MSQYKNACPIDTASTVDEDFRAVNQCILEQLHSDVPLVEKISHYIIDAGGKRLRPLLVLLSARACHYQGNQHIPLATIIEFLHTATLLHDDVVDSSDLRRGRSTAHTRWGNGPSVLVGDFLYSRAFQMMVNIGRMDVMTSLSNATNVIAEGEVMQLSNIRNPDTTEEHYMAIVRCKTAMLFEASAHTAALLADAPEQQTQALKNYGNYLGLAFQLIDDLLDYTGNAEAMGKNIGDDLAEGKPTLPLIYTMKHGTDKQASLARNVIRQGSLAALDDILKAVRGCGALDYTAKRAHEYASRAIKAITILPQTPQREALVKLAESSTSRIG